MNSSQGKKKKLSEYQFEDIKDFFLEIFRKISSKIILLEIGNDFINIGLAKSHKNKIYIKKVFKQELPEEALDKSIPVNAISLGIFLNQIIKEEKLNTNRVAICLPSDACYTRLIEIPEEVAEDESTLFLENPNSEIQIPISLKNSDFAINLTNLPKKESKNKIYNKYFLTSIPKKNVDIILDSIRNANLEICSLQMSHMCIASLLKTEINKLNENQLIISIDLLDEFTQLIIFDSSGPLFLKRLASIRNYPSINDMKKINNKNDSKNKKSKDTNNSKNYHPLSNLDLKVLLREINESINNFLNENNLNKKGKILLSGRNSQHKNLVELLGKNLKMDVALISPINNFSVNEFSYNPDEINQSSMSRLIGLGLTLIKNNELEDESLNREFIVKSYTYNDDIDKDSENLNSFKTLKKENKKFKDISEKKTKIEEKKNELPPLPNLKLKNNSEKKTKIEEKKKELPPLPNLKLKDTSEKKTKIEDKKKEFPPLPNVEIQTKSESNNKNSINNKLNNKKDKVNNEENKPFKMDKSFLKDD